MKTDFGYEVGAVIESLRMRMTHFFNSGHTEMTCWQFGGGRSRLTIDNPCRMMFGGPVQTKWTLATATPLAGFNDLNRTPKCPADSVAKRYA